MLQRIAAEAGTGVHLSPPRRAVVEMTARSWPLYPPGDVVVAGGCEPVPAGSRRGALADVVVRRRGRDRRRELRVPLAQFLYLPIFVAALRSFDPVGEGEGRAQVGAPRRASRELVRAPRPRSSASRAT